MTADASVSYRPLLPDEAVEAGASEDIVIDLRAWSDWDSDATGVFRCVDGVPVELLGSDGGEPEDQTIRRDWKWVAPALQAAYDLGRSGGAA